MIVADAAVKPGPRGVGPTRALLQLLQVRFGSGHRLRHLSAALGRGCRASKLGISLVVVGQPRATCPSQNSLTAQQCKMSASTGFVPLWVGRSCKSPPSRSSTSASICPKAYLREARPVMVA